MGNIIKILSTYDLQDWIMVVLVIGIFIEITPIKLNPIQWIGKCLNRSINNQVSELRSEILQEIALVREQHKEQVDAMNIRINDIEKQQATILQKTNENEIRRIRFEIISFSNSISNGTKHHVDEYAHIFDINDTYHGLIKEAGLTNGQIDQEMLFIREHYQEHRKLKEDYF